MPWFEYECEKCGERVARQRPVAHRDVTPRHNAVDGCWDGLLRRIAPVRGPDVLRGREERGAAPHAGAAPRAGGSANL